MSPEVEMLRGVRILLAEDHPFNRQVAVEFLEQAGATVNCVNSGKEVLDLLRRERFDCVLMDVQMPGMDGLETTRMIRTDTTLRGLPVIAMTAGASNDERQCCFAAGMDDFVGKPFRPDSLYATVAKWVRKNRDSG
jgi:two-component system, sensor histidine kinase and response regulator